MKKSSLLALGGLLLALAFWKGPLALAGGGSVIYQPDQVEWAGLEFQARYGNALPTADVPVSAVCADGRDRSTIVCVLRFTSACSPSALKAREDGLQFSFDAYKKSKGWNWLKLKFDEEPLADASSPH